MEIEMKPRKVIQGKNIVLVSLPVVWADNLKLKKGDSLRCKINTEGQLVLWKDIKGVDGNETGD
jgi:hypothetical protein